ncbi:hypothetical protein P171DRAFT_198584 [Karstenula rhodostoma CBS 690.94]|uniref:Uncharacterized protein n=1 Tax=Karstenula rhodostoma CBS 690.94 TaxID=1392251 RepID=A0A9P4PT47_9PLEO|nr:hypothetical protein P171DRAFT_198584 [Karstenula rhodostoma CBS 690.94]
MSDRSVSPFTVNPDFNPAAAPPAPAHVVHNPPVPLQIDDIDPENEYLNNLRNLFAPPIDMSNPFAQHTIHRHMPFTIASVLPRTAYKEEWEPKERRSDAYLAMQIQILTYLTTHAADELHPAQAHFFTENAGTKTHAPTAKQAVELCYFMRSHGFDTYVRLDPRGEKLRFYIADRDAGERRGQDSLYWQQDMKTGAVVPMEELARMGVRQRGRPWRRNALPYIFQDVETVW